MSYWGPVVLDGKIRYLSVSQLERFDSECDGGCERKWWYRYVARHKEAEKDAAKVGTKAHAQLELYLRTNQDVLGDVVRAGMRFLPKPGADLLIEHEFGRLVRLGPDGYDGPLVSVLMAAGVPLVGKIDLLHRRGEWIDDAGVTYEEKDTAEAEDWKTTKQIANEYDETTGDLKARGYAKSADELAATWQMNGYGIVAIKQWPDLKFVRMSHGVFQTGRTRLASKRSKLVAVEDVKRNWERSDLLVERMKAVATITKVEDVKANYKACGAYGGCAFRDKCPRDPKLVLAESFRTTARLTRSLTKEDLDMSLLKMMGTKPAAAAASGDTTDIAAEKAKLLVEEQKIKSTQKSTSANVLSPDSPKAAPPKEVATPPMEVKSEAKTDKKGISVQCAGVGTQVDLTTDEAIEKKAQCPECGEVVKMTKPQKLGDKWCAVVGKHSLTVEASKEEVKEEAKEEVKAPEPAKAEEPKAVLIKAAEPKYLGFVLYYNCQGRRTLSLRDYLNPILRDLEKTYNVIDVKIAPGDNPLGFGRWKGALSAIVRAKPPEPGHYSVHAGDEEARVAFDELAPTAYDVVWGLG